MQRENLINDALGYLDPTSGASDDRAAGVVVGMVSVLMALGYSFERATAYLKTHLPPNARVNALPDTWQPHFK